MEDLEKIEQYQIWFDNLSFFGGNTFILDAIEDLWKLINFAGSLFSQTNAKINIKGMNYSKVSKEETLRFVQSFFDKFNIKLNVSDLVKNNVLILEEDGEKKVNTFFNSRQSGHNYYDANGNKCISVVLEGSFLDGIVLVHELMHYLNQSDIKRSFCSNLFTEAISYGAESIYVFSFSEDFCSLDNKLYFNGMFHTIYSYFYQIYYIYKIILLYKRKGDIKESLYDEMFSDKGFLITMEEFDKFVSEKNSILSSTSYVIGFTLAIYLFMEYRKDQNSFDLLLKLNDTILNNDNISVQECLIKIGFSSEDDFIKKIKNSLNEFLKFISELNEIQKIL